MIGGCWWMWTTQQNKAPQTRGIFQKYWLHICTFLSPNFYPLGHFSFGGRATLSLDFPKHHQNIWGVQPNSRSDNLGKSAFTRWLKNLWPFDSRSLEVTFTMTFSGSQRRCTSNFFHFTAFSMEAGLPDFLKCPIFCFKIFGHPLDWLIRFHLAQRNPGALPNFLGTVRSLAWLIQIMFLDRVCMLIGEMMVKYS